MRTKSYEAVLREELRDADVAAEYLSAAVELRSMDGLADALRHVIEAHGGIVPIAEISGVDRDEIAHLLSPNSSFPLRTMVRVLNAVGITLSFSNSR